MEYPFVKMHGCGNDYLYFNCLTRELPNPAELSIRLSDRHFGIGGDGIVLICPSEKADAKMRIFNADGSESQMCGNATRCVGKYLYDRKLVCKKEIAIETLCGLKHVRLQFDGDSVVGARVDMGPASLDPASLPVLLPGSRIVGQPVEIVDTVYAVTCVSMGNPHCVVFMDDVDSLPLERIGPLFENSPLFPERTNAEFVKVLDRHTLQMRVWERGSGITLACGTGACAAAVAAYENGLTEREQVKVLLPGGRLTIDYTSDAVYMTGPAVQVFEGTVSL